MRSLSIFLDFKGKKMSKKLSEDEKLVALGTMCKSFTKEQVEHLDSLKTVDARYKCAQRYMREINEGKKGERIKAERAYKRYAEIIDGLECVDDGLWTDEKKIMAFSAILDAYCDKCVKLVENNNRKRLEHLKGQLELRTKSFEAETSKLKAEIVKLEEKLR